VGERSSDRIAEKKKGRKDRRFSMSAEGTAVPTATNGWAGGNLGLRCEEACKEKGISKAANLFFH